MDEEEKKDGYVPEEDGGDVAYPWDPSLPGNHAPAGVGVNGNARNNAGEVHGDAGSDVSAGNTGSAGNSDPYVGIYTGSNYGDLEDFIRREMAGYKLESESERRARERRERRTRSLASVADVLGSMHRAYAHARGVQPSHA